MKMEQFFFFNTEVEESRMFLSVQRLRFQSIEFSRIKLYDWTTLYVIGTNSKLNYLNIDNIKS